jgi:phosphate acetyltransferase
MLVETGVVDGLVGGATYSTADTVRPGLQLVKTKPGESIVSSVFIMLKGDEKLVFGDCAINPQPNSEQLAQIAVQSANTARVFGIEPKVGLLSFSTNGSAKHDLVSNVSGAKEILDGMSTDFAYEGELQFDSAYVEATAAKKFPESKVAGKVNTFIFPDLQAGNIGYKIAQRMGGYEALGPILQGLNKPINDLSRGCSVDDVYKLSIITASQSL